MQYDLCRSEFTTHSQHNVPISSPAAWSSPSTSFTHFHFRYQELFYLWGRPEPVWNPHWRPQHLLYQLLPLHPLRIDLKQIVSSTCRPPVSSNWSKSLPAFMVKESTIQPIPTCLKSLLIRLSSALDITLRYYTSPWAYLSLPAGFPSLFFTHGAGGAGWEKQRWQSEGERRRPGDANRVRHQKVQVFDDTHFLALPLSGIHGVIKSSFVLFPHPSPSQLISHLMDTLVIKTIIVILWHIDLTVNSLSW